MKKALPIIFIIVFTFFIWKPVANQAMIGEGPIYFNPPYLHMLDTNSIETLWTRHDSQALLFFQLIRDVFRDNIQLYMLFLICGSAFVNVCLFLLIKKVTKSNLAALISSILFIADFVGSYEILGMGYYQWFIQRVPNFGLALLSFILFIEYLKKYNRKIYFLSLILYLAAVFLARYTIHILPMFVLYAFFVFPLNNRSKKIIYYILLISPFIIGSVILFKAQGLVAGTKDVTLQESLKLIPNIFYQITYLTFPFLKLQVVKTLTLLITIIYILLTYIICRKSKTARPFILSLAVSIPLSVYLSILLNKVFISYYDSSRYLYYSSLLVSSFWGIVLWYFSQSKKIFLYMTIVAVLFWITYNKNVLDKRFAETQEKHSTVLATFNYVRANKETFGPNSLIFVPKEVGVYGAGMLQYFYGDKSLFFLPDTPETKSSSTWPIQPQHIVHIKK